jgi:hypothetical protein
MILPDLVQTTILSKILIAPARVSVGQPDNGEGHRKQSKETGPIIQGVSVAVGSGSARINKK